MYYIQWTLHAAITLELVSSSVMVTEGSGGPAGERVEVTVVVSSSGGETERPITVFLITSDETATGEIYTLHFTIRI